MAPSNLKSFLCAALLTVADARHIALNGKRGIIGPGVTVTVTETVTESICSGIDTSVLGFPASSDATFSFDITTIGVPTTADDFLSFTADITPFPSDTGVPFSTDDVTFIDHITDATDDLPGFTSQVSDVSIATSVETTAVETTPVDSTAVETTAVETTPVDSTAVETTPVETTAAETSTVETTPSTTQDPEDPDETLFPTNTFSFDIPTVFPTIVDPPSSTTASPSTTPAGPEPTITTEYETDAGTYNYAGCFTDPTGAGLPVDPVLATTSVGDVQECLDFCGETAPGFPYSYANIVVSECYCGNALATTSTGTCDVPCADKPLEICGGNPPAAPRTSKRVAGGSGVVYVLDPNEGTATTTSAASSTTSSSSSTTTTTTTSSASTTSSSSASTSASTTASACPAKATITNGGFEVGPFSAAWTVGFQNQMVTPVRRNANTVGVPAYGNFVVQQIVDDGENAMYQQRVSICPDKRYTITAVAVSESPEPKNPPPYCQLYLCANGPNNCGRPVIIRPGALRRATHTFVTGKTASRIFVQVWLYCPGTLQGRQNTLYTDQVTIDAA